MVVGPIDELALEEDAREPDGLDALVDEGLHVSVGELGRVAHVLAGDGVHARLEQLVVGTPRDHDPESQLGEDGEPQGVVLVHAQHSRNPDLAAGVLPAAQTPVGEGAPVLVVVEVGHVGLLGAPLLGGAALAAVARDMPLAVAEGGDRQLAVVLAQLAHGGLGGQAEAGQLGERHERGGHAVVGLPGGQGGTEAAHEAGDVGAHHLAPGEQLEGAQDGVVEEGPALDGDVVAELVGVAQLDDLVQGVANHRVGQPSADLPGGGRLLLGLLDRGVHEHGAAGPQVHRALGAQGLLGELLDRLPHGLGEGLQEGAAAGRAGLVDADGVDGAAADAQVLHVLPADVDDGGDLRIEAGGRPVVGHGLHDALVDVQGRLDDALAVAGDAGAHDAHVIGHLQVDAAQDLDGGGDGVALVARVMLPGDIARLVQDDGLDGGGAGVDAQEAVDARGGVGGFRGLSRIGALGALLDGAGADGVGTGGADGGRGVRCGIAVRAVGGALDGGSGIVDVIRTLRDGRGRGLGPAGAGNGGAGVALAEGGELVVVGEERPHAGGGQAQGLAGGQARGEFGEGDRLAGRHESGADGDVELGVAGTGEGVDLVGQGALEGAAQLGQEMEGAAQEHDVAADGAPAGQARDGLGDDGLED